MNIMNWNRVRMKFSRMKFGRKSGGFALPEVLCAIVILSLSLLASFSAMSYALTLTVETRNRMNDFSLVMQEEVAFNTWAEGYGTSTTPPPLGAGVRAVSEKVFLTDFTKGSSSVEGLAGGPLWLDITKFETSFDAAGKRPKRVMGSPVSILFNKADTADDANNTPK
jgi:prepilin-type N-terminal cleavage/methylation domain-containing protein